MVWTFDCFESCDFPVYFTSMLRSALSWNLEDHSQTRAYFPLDIECLMTAKYVHNVLIYFFMNSFSVSIFLKNMLILLDRLIAKSSAGQFHESLKYIQSKYIKENIIVGWQCSSVAEHLALDSVLSTKKKRQRRKKNTILLLSLAISFGNIR